MQHRTRTPRAPKPLTVPALGAVAGVALFVVGLGPLNNVDVAALGLIFFFWGVLSLATLALTRRLRARRIARSDVPQMDA